MKINAQNEKKDNMKNMLFRNKMTDIKGYRPLKVVFDSSFFEKEL